MKKLLFSEILVLSFHQIKRKKKQTNTTSTCLKCLFIVITRPRITYKYLTLAAYLNVKLLSRKCNIKTKECRTNKYVQIIKNPFTVEQNTVCTEKFTAPVNRLASKKYSNWLRFIAATRHAQGLLFRFLVG